MPCVSMSAVPFLAAGAPAHYDHSTLSMYKLNVRTVEATTFCRRSSPPTLPGRRSCAPEPARCRSSWGFSALTVWHGRVQLGHDRDGASGASRGTGPRTGGLSHEERTR